MALLTRTGLRINIYCSMADFQFSKWQLSAILNLQKLEILTPGPGPGTLCVICQISRRYVEPFRRYGRFLIFQYGGRRHLGFWKFQIFDGCDAQEGRTASACQILSKSLKTRLRYGDFQFFKMAAVRHLGLVLRVLGPPTKSNWWSL